jgi:hypothetical protein
MGGTVFETKAKGKTAAEAFAAAREQAQYDRGHSGYTGTIAEKHEFTMIPFDGKAPNGGTETLDQFIARLIDADDPRICDKWGPAGCIKSSEGEFVFFGWASC